MQVLSYMLATGTAAGFGLTVDLYNSLSGTSSFLNKANASASLLFFAFVFSAVSSVFSSYALPKKS
ncbi:PREDICTED: CASP-like protein 4D1 [Erythranthe guttata]|uniref:CASP-like protein 4D1 n=1 Tax=Erythranthe guttata TaxID=4155 RepID=UPI00064D8751|nr:PREDICTED: CASP-like protein 4D1 [Erythranthe guttata]|eukprot:XP_012842459.1 PREDICTED: CASP-like protein 4D1 [Erythranthe guttata]